MDEDKQGGWGLRMSRIGKDQEDAIGNPLQLSLACATYELQLWHTNEQLIVFGQSTARTAASARTEGPLGRREGLAGDNTETTA